MSEKQSQLKTNWKLRLFSVMPHAAWDYFEYDPRSHSMIVVWKDETTSTFTRVSRGLWTRLSEARSKMEFIRRNFKNAFVILAMRPPIDAGRAVNGKGDGR